MKKLTPKQAKTLRIVGDSVFFIIIATMVTFFTWNFIDIKSGYKYPIFGARTSIIVSPSMATVNEANDYITSDMKQIQKNDVITTVGYKSFDDIKIYDVATYYTGSKNLVCHRVVNKYVSEDGIQYVIFRGDANNIDDAPVSYNLIRGKVVNVTPKAGHFVSFVQSPYFFIAIFGTVFFVALGLFIVNLGKEKKQPEAQNSGDNPQEPTEQPVETPPEEAQQEEEKKE